jgi:hypothetical protein
MKSALFLSNLKFGQAGPAPPPPAESQIANFRFKMKGTLFISNLKFAI